MAHLKGFVNSAKSLSKNPLGIIALFIVMIYGIASSVLTFGGSNLQSTAERLPIVWFLALFPLAVLAVFAWLVAYHHKNLYAPSDYSEDKSFLKTIASSGVPLEIMENEKGSIDTSNRNEAPPQGDADG